jgi:fumarate hydratase subunit alpha
MRTIQFADVVKAAADLCGQAACFLPDDVKKSLLEAGKKESGELGKDFFRQYEENFKIAESEHLPLCQDTGFAVWFVEYGTELQFDSGDIYEALNEATRKGYTEHYLRKSIVEEPLFERKNTKDNTPAIVHIKMVQGDTFKIDVAPKGGGSENLSTVKMLIPADGVQGIKDLVVKTVTEAGGKPCPPIVVGVGIGGNFEKCALMAKEALFREIDDESSDPIARQLEKELLELVNNTGVGAMGFGGTQTCLAVKVNVHPCHIARLPVAINIQCHSARHKSATL